MSDEKQNKTDEPCSCADGGPTASPEKATESDRKCAEKTANQTADEAGNQLPPIDFSTFLFSLATQAMMMMGETMLPNQPELPIDLPGAKRTIDIVAMLEEKSKGNLNEAEKGLLQNLLYDLRSRYVKAAR